MALALRARAPGAVSARVQRLGDRPVVLVDVEAEIHRGALSSTASGTLAEAARTAKDQRLPLVAHIASSGADIVEGMLGEIGSVENVPGFIEDVKAGKGRLMGFGHRVYKNYDPRATIIKQTAYDVFEVTGKNPLLDIALKLEEAALSDDYFKSRKLYPNVDFYSGLIYQAMSSMSRCS